MLSVLVPASFLALLIPGYAFARATDPDLQRAGLPAVIARSYLAVLLLLTPMSLLGYYLHLPVSLLTNYVVFLVLAALVWVSGQHRWRDLFWLLGGVLTIEFLLVVGELVLSARAESYFGGDAGFHVDRARMLLAYDMSDLDPRGESGGPVWTYPFNLMHALLAVGASFLDSTPRTVWYAALPCAKLFIACSGYYLGWSAFRSRWAAWATGLFLLGTVAPKTVILYPNHLANYALMPLALSFTLDLARHRRAGWATPLRLATVMIVLSQTHILYAALLVLILAPTLLLLLLWRLVNRRRPLALVTCAGLALAAAVPVPLIGWARDSSFARALVIAGVQDEEMPIPVEGPVKPLRQSSGRYYFLGTVPDSELPWSMVKPDNMLAAWQPVGLAMALLGATAILATTRRREPRLTILVFGATCVVLFFPPVCTAMVYLMGRGWALYRLTSFFYPLTAVLAAGTAGYLLDRLTRQAAYAGRRQLVRC